MPGTQQTVDAAKFAALAANSDEFIGMCDMGFRPFYANPAGLRLVGLESVEEACSTSVFEFFFPEDRRYLEEVFFPGVLRDGRADYEVRFRHFKTGAAIWMIYTVFLLRDEKGDPLGYATVSRDITERKRTETALRESLLFRREAEKIGRIGAWKVSPATNYLYWTEGVYEIVEAPLDYRPGLEEGLKLYDAEAIPVLKKALEAALQNGTPFVVEAGATTMTGRHLWTEVRGLGRIEEGGDAFVMGTFQDITELKRAEEALRLSEEQLRLKLDSILSPDVEVEEGELVNLLDIPALQSLMDDFSNLSKAVVAIVDLRGKVLLSSGWQDICTKFHRANPESARYCTESDLALSKELNPGEHACYHCHNGLWDVVTPLMVGGKHVANIYTGQFFYEDDEVDEGFFSAQASRFGFDREHYLSALRRVPRVSREWVETLMVFLTKFSDLVSKSSYSNLKLAKALARQKRIEDDLRASEEQFRAMFELASVGVAQTDPFTSRFLRANRKMCEITGYSEEELLQKHVPEITHPDDREADREMLGLIVRGERPDYRVEKRYIRKDGAEAWVNVNMTVIRDQSGQPVRTMATVEDIGERKRAERESFDAKRRLELAMNAVQMGVWEFDFTAEKLYWSPELFKYLSLPPCEPSRKLMLGLVHPDDVEISQKAMDKAVAEHGIYHCEYRIVLDGKTLWLEDRGEIIRDDQDRPIRVIGTAQNITERKSAEEERKAALLRAERAAAVKGEFLSVMSHELRTPLNGVLGFTELLSDTSLDVEQQAYVRTIRSSGEHLLAVVNDVLDFSSLEKGVMAVENTSFAVADLLGLSEQAIRKTAEDKGLKFVSEIGAGVPDQVSGDERRIRQILINLLGNAAKFTSRGSVALRVAPASDENGARFLDFSVEDTGIGMSAETLAVLFRPFTQAEMKTNRTFGGTGLGLAISQRLAAAMGGKITVESTPGKGSTFTFRLPLKSSSASLGGSPASGAAPPISSAGNLVLVVEDDGVSRAVAMQMLKTLGYPAEFAADGAQAVESFVPGKYSHILMDVSLPVMDGIAATELIRAKEKTTPHRAWIIAFTANVMPGDRERCLAADMDDFLSKPFRKDELAAKLACSK